LSQINPVYTTPSYLSQIHFNIVPCWRYLLGLQTTPLNYSPAFIADYTVGITIVLLQAVLTLIVLTVALSVDSRVPRQFPYCTVLLAPSTVDSLEVGWLSLTVELTLTDCRTNCLTLRNSSLKVGMCGRYSEHLVPRSYTQCMNLVTGETSVVYITWVANRCYGYEIRNQLSVEWQRHRFLGTRLHRQQRRYIRLLDSSDNLRIRSPSQYYPPTYVLLFVVVSYTTIGTIMVLYILIFMFLDSRREDKMFWAEW
jgi:hypothetical protein